jgi:hypothetical protein
MLSWMRYGLHYKSINIHKRYGCAGSPHADHDFFFGNELGGCDLLDLGFEFARFCVLGMMIRVHENTSHSVRELKGYTRRENANHYLLEFNQIR